MARKKRPLFSREHEKTNGNLRTVYIFRIFKGLINVPASHDGVSKQVQVRAFRISVEYKMYRGEYMIDTDFHDFGYVTARANEITHALRQFEESESISKMVDIMEVLKEEFREALRRDANRQLKRELGYSKPSSSVLRSNTTRKPLPQIKLPWDSGDKA